MNEEMFKTRHLAFLILTLASAPLFTWANALPVSSVDPRAFLPAAPGFAHPRRCGSVDFRGALGHAKNQGETLYCFAYSTADLIEQRTGRNISALDLATTYFFAETERIRRKPTPFLQDYFRDHPAWVERIERERLSESISIAPITKGGDVFHPMFHKLGGGTETTTILLANGQGLCDEASFPSDGGLNRYLNFISRLETAALNHTLGAGPEIEALPMRFRSPEADAFNTAWLRWIESRCRRSPSPIPLIPIGVDVAEDLPQYYAKVRAGSITKADQQKVFASLDYALDHGRIASIGYDLDYVLRPGLPDSDPDTGEGAGDHASAVVGRRASVTGECEYLVRDPSGYPCAAYKDRFIPRCRDRHVWILESELSESLYSVVYLR